MDSSQIVELLIKMLLIICCQKRQTKRATSILLIFGFLLCSLYQVGAKRIVSQSNVDAFSGEVASRKVLRVGKESATGRGDAFSWTTDQTVSCSKDDILVYQGATPPLPNGIPTYTVQILNTCTAPDGGVEGCTVSDVHLSCGWFSSARLVNPRVFRRLAYDDCLVNDGASLAPGDSVSFQYANSYSYPLQVSSVNCCS